MKAECLHKQKIRTFIQSKDFDTISPHIGKPLTFLERKTISQLRLGMLPFRIETARYCRQIIPENERLCYCESGLVESEFHAIFKYSMYHQLREKWLSNLNIPDNFHQLSIGNKFKIVLNRPENVRHSAKFLISLMDSRRLLNKMY